MLNNLSFLDFFLKTSPVISIRQKKPKKAVNAVSTFGWCGMSNVKGDAAEVGLGATVVVFTMVAVAVSVVV
jgi:hypothetical protein